VNWIKGQSCIHNPDVGGSIPPRDHRIDRVDVSKLFPAKILVEHRAAKLVMPIRRFVGCLFQIDIVDELTEIIVNGLFRPTPKPNLCFLVSFLISSECGLTALLDGTT